jgi:hypothetical protein
MTRKYTISRRPGPRNRHGLFYGSWCPLWNGAGHVSWPFMYMVSISWHVQSLLELLMIWSYAVSEIHDFKAIKKWYIFESANFLPMAWQRYELRRKSQQTIAGQQQAAEWTCRRRSGSSVLVSAFQPDSIVCERIVPNTYAQFRLEPDLPEQNCCV